MFELLIGKTSNAIVVIDGVGFLGEVGVTGFIDGEELASAIGLEAGTAQHTEEPWLHFTHEGRTLYIAKKPLRYSVSWDNLNSLGAVFGTKTIEVNGLNYKVRLLRRCNNDRTLTVDGFNLSLVENSEWSVLLGAVFNGIGLDPRDETPIGEWPNYSVVDLGMDSMSTPGYYQICQETMLNYPYKVLGGFPSLGYAGYTTSSDNGTRIGWRPVLELVE